jgi:hypothetical protein
MFVLMPSGKYELHIYFTLIQEFYPPHIRNNLMILWHNKCRDVQQSLFRSRNYQKQTLAYHVSTKFILKLFFEQTCLHLTYVYVEYEIVFPDGIFEMMMVQK